MAATSFDAAAAADLGFDFFIYDEEQQLQQPQSLQQQQQQPHQYTQQHTQPSQFQQPQPQQQPQQLQTQPPQLPTGRCNYVDLTHGSGAAQCGCRRFWSRGPSTPAATAATTPTVHQQFGLLTSSAVPPSDPGYCMCSHHACFHDHDQAQTQAATSVNTSFFNISVPAVDAAVGQENEKPRAALSPVQLGHQLQLEQLQQLEQLVEEQQLLQEHIPQQPEEQEQSIPDTLSWGGLQLDLPSQPQSLPHLLSLDNSITHPPPSQASQKASSTTSSRYMRPFAGRGLDTLPEGRPANAAFGTSTPAFSTALVPASKALSVTGSTISTATASTTTPVSQALRAHDARLERLENPSFFSSTNSQALFTLKEDCLERHDQVDLRVTELESRMEDVERRIADEGGSVRESIRESTRGSVATASVSSAVSLATPRSSAPPDTNTSLLRQLHTLQQEVALLHQEASLASAASSSSGPSPKNPWLLEVVFMPFPLKGLWVEASQFATAAAVAAASAAKRRQEFFTRDHLFSAPDEWTLESVDSVDKSDVPRLLPRACAPGRLIDRRLRSRGLVHTVTVRGADARAVEAAVAEAFFSLASLAPKTDDNPKTASMTTSLGLQHPWVPLRKVHKDSRLRFLTRAEMATPALWTPAFLKESVVMKVGQAAESEDKKHRLYITQPGAYTQDRQAHAGGWSWGRLRGAEAVGEGEGASNGHDESVWEWNSRLDEAPVDTQSTEATTATDTVEDVGAEVGVSDHAPEKDVLVDVVLEAAPTPTVPISSKATTNPASSRSPSSSQFFTVNQSPARPISALSALTSSRSTSSHRLSSARRSMSPFFVSAVQSSGMQTGLQTAMQSGQPGMPSGMQSRSARPPPIRTTSARTSISRVSKRRSPSVGFAANFWPRNTPRYSRSPSAAPPSARVRGTTPFCYATPYSNAYDDHDHDHDDEGHGEENPAHRRRTYPGYGFNGGFNGGFEMGLDDAMDMMGYGSDDYDEVDFDEGDAEDGEDIPMTQDGDDIQVYEDRDDAHLMSEQEAGQGEEREKPLLPEDEPWPGIDSNYEGDSGGYDGSSSSQSDRSDGSHVVDEDDEMSDENLDPELTEQQSQLSQHSQLSNSQHSQQQQQQLNQLTEPTEPAQPAQPADPASHAFPYSHHNPPHDSDSSQPSEYPSTRRPRKRQQPPQPHQLVNEARQFGMYGFDGGMGFKIHEDEA